METRVIPPSEWPRLAGTELEAVWPVLPPDARVLVIEDAGVIVGCWAAFTKVHVEGVWIAPAHRGKASVARRLMAGMRRVVRAMGAESVATGATTDDVRNLLTRIGATQLPGDHYVLSL